MFGFHSCQVESLFSEGEHEGVCWGRGGGGGGGDSGGGGAVGLRARWGK